MLIGSAAILDWLDQTVGPERALIPPGGVERRRALRLTALATGAIDKAGAASYERIIRPSTFRWPEWSVRCTTQARSAIAALAAEPWPGAAPLNPAQITTACMIATRGWPIPSSWLRQGVEGRIAARRRCEARPEFKATYPADYVLPRGE